jgi:thioredoxin-related protein
MKVLLIISLLFLFPGIFKAQESQNYESLWLKNFQTAKDSAVKVNKPILISFSGSDWCKPCIKLRKQILDTKDFMDFATSTFILVHADLPYHTPISKEQRQHNEALAEIYNTEGTFPKLVITNPSGKQVYSCSYMDKTVEQYIELLKENLPK